VHGIDTVKQMSPQIDIGSLTNYFNDVLVAELFAKDGLGPEDFIVMPIYETRSMLYMGIINKNNSYGMQLKTITPDAEIDKFYGLFDIREGLQNHTNIIGIHKATSFNIFKALYKNTINKIKKLSLDYAHNSDNLELTPGFIIPLLTFYSNYTYFPQLQVIWTNSGCQIYLPGIEAPGSNPGKLLEMNKLLSIIEPPKVPRVAITQRNIQKTRRFNWRAAYLKHCGDPESHYAKQKNGLSVPHGTPRLEEMQAVNYTTFEPSISIAKLEQHMNKMDIQPKKPT
jgi:hypothetical protein